MKKFLFSIAFIIICRCFSYSQVYVTEELRSTDEKQQSKKVQSKNFSDKSKKNQSSFVVVKSNKLTNEYRTSQPLFDMNNVSDYYKLVDVKAVNNNSFYSQEELDQFSKYATVDFNKFHFLVSSKLDEIYLIKRHHLDDYVIKNLQRIENELHVANCKSCQDSVYRIVLLNESELVLELKPQDEKDLFVYLLNLKK